MSRDEGQRFFIRLFRQLARHWYTPDADGPNIPHAYEV